MQPSSFRLALDESTRMMYAEFMPQADVPLPDRDALVRAAAHCGWGESAFADPAVTVFLNRCHAASEPFRLAVGEVRDGLFDLELDADGTFLLFDLEPPRGGRPVRLSEVRDALAQRGVVYGVKQAALLDALKAGRCRRVVIAEGLPPTPGTPVRFESLLDNLKPKPPLDDDTALIDFRDLGQLLLVSPGTPLMRRVPPVPGSEGVDVFGRPIPAPAIADIQFESGLQGVAVDEDDPNLLRATIAGMPKIQGPGRVIVDPVVVVSAVDLVSGNIDFDGTLQVRGDITAGMSVRVTGDIVVRGTIEAAHVEAGGDVTVNGGIIGVQSAGLATEDDATRVAHIVAGGSVKARFMVSAFISAQQSVSAEREIRQCEVLAGETVIVGRPGSRDGRIMGGRIRAGRHVRAAHLGSPAGMPTVIHAGVNPHAPALLGEAEARRERIIDEKLKLGQLMQMLDNGAITDPEQAARIRKTYTGLAMELTELEKRIAALTDQTVPSMEARIEVFKGVSPGVTIHYGGRQRTFVEEHGGGNAMLDKNEIVMK